MGYVRPTALNNPEYVLLSSSFPQQPNAYDFLVNAPWRALAVAAWDDRASVPSSGLNVVFVVQYKGLNLGAYQLAARKIITYPGASDYQQYTVSANVQDYNQGYVDFWDPDAIQQANGLYAFPPGGLFSLPAKSSQALDSSFSAHGTQEVFQWIPSTQSGGGGGAALVQTCPPMKRPPWPYHHDTLSVGSGPPGLVPSKGRVIGMGGQNFDFRK